jgi:hypothetical protein
MIVHARGDAMDSANECSRTASDHSQSDAALSFTRACA